MKAILLAAGMGTRLLPLTRTVPKCMVLIQGKPLLQYWLELLTEAGITEILINLHHHADSVRNWVGSSPYSKMVQLVYEPQLLGTGGTVLANASFVEGETFLLAHADNLTTFDVRAFINRHRVRPSGAEMTMMLFHSETPESCGIVELDGNHVVQNFFEKVRNPPGNLANGAVYLMEPSIIQFMRNLDKPIVDLSTEVIPNFKGKIFTFINDQYHRDIGTPMSLESAQNDYSPI